ncbi:MAG: AbrB/MazE/SpoVT family DNA-binding domain-containing protein [Anaerolineae bacterium]|jgi:AbrB family looped-hinge helix DNA binding protein
MTNTILQIRSNGQITLPAVLRREANLNEGDVLEVVVEGDGTLHLIPKVAIDRSQAYFWTQRWQEGEKEAESDLQAGRARRFDSVEAAIEFLDSPD